MGSAPVLGERIAGQWTETAFTAKDGSRSAASLTGKETSLPYERKDNQEEEVYIWSLPV